MANLSPASNSKTNGVLGLLQLQDSVAVARSHFGSSYFSCQSGGVTGPSVSFCVRLSNRFAVADMAELAAPAAIDEPLHLVVLVDDIVMNTFGNADRPPTNKTAKLEFERFVRSGPAERVRIIIQWWFKRPQMGARCRTMFHQKEMADREARRKRRTYQNRRANQEAYDEMMDENEEFQIFFQHAIEDGYAGGDDHEGLVLDDEEGMMNPAVGDADAHVSFVPPLVVVPLGLPRVSSHAAGVEGLCRTRLESGADDDPATRSTKRRPASESWESTTTGKRGDLDKNGWPRAWRQVSSSAETSPTSPSSVSGSSASSSRDEFVGIVISE